MSDLVERLRAEQVLKIDKYSKTTMRRNPDGPEAAARIEMLETALRDHNCGTPGCPCISTGTASADTSANVAAIDLVALQESAEFLRTVKAATGQYDAQFSLASVRLQRAAARITALETALAEAEGWVIADVVAWLRDNAGKDADDLRRLHAGKKLTPPMTEDWYAMIQTKAGIATALETGEWKKDSPSPPPVV